MKKLIRVLILTLGLATIIPPHLAYASSYLCDGREYLNGYECVKSTGYSGQQTWGYPLSSGHNCTNYAAYRLSRNGATNPGNLGSASDWAVNARAKGIRVDGTAEVGSIAQWNIGNATSTGHVAYVEVVTDSYIDISEDNWGGVTNMRRFYKGQGDWPSNFIHLKDAGGWNGVGSATFIGTSSLNNGAVLRANQYILSENGKYVLMMQSDGNLVLYGGGRAAWASQTSGNPGAYLGIQSDGNAVIYTGSGPKWATGTYSISRLVLQNDGNLVGYTASNQVAWASNTMLGGDDIVPKGSGQLVSGSTLSRGQYLRSSDKRYFLVMQGDGNLVLYAPGQRVLWASGADGNPGAYLGVQSDGNAVIYASGRAKWATNTNSIYRLVMQNDGNLVGYTSDSRSKLTLSSGALRSISSTKVSTEPTKYPQFHRYLPDCMYLVAVSKSGFSLNDST